MKNLSRKIRIKLVILGSLIVLFGILFGIRYIPDVSEWWSRTISRSYHYVFGKLADWLPFSLFEVTFFLLIASVIIWFVFFVKHARKEGAKKSSHRLLTLAIVAFAVITCYTGTAGMEYYRKAPPIPQYKEVLVDTTKYEEIGRYFIDDLNYCSSKLEYDENGSAICPYSYDILNDIMEREFKILSDDYYSQYTVNAKPMYLTSWAYTQFRITGVSFAPTGEANFNILNCAGDLPFTIAHEICHTKGIMRENDANIIAMWVCLNADNPYVRYSGYVNVLPSLFEMFKAMNNEDAYGRLYWSVNENVWKDLKFINDFWTSHNLVEKVFEKISTFFNDLYLKILGNQDTSAYVDHPQGEEIIVPGEPPKYVIREYSPYQAMLMHLFMNK